MPNYFANNNQFRPHSNESKLPVLESITGKMDHTTSRPGYSHSGSWFIVHLISDDETFSVYFDYEHITADDISRLESLRGRTITLSCKGGLPIINVLGISSDGEIRAVLLKGVAAGTIKMEDLPALLQFAKGDDEALELWHQFKKQFENKRVEDIKESIEKENKEWQKVIKRNNAKRDSLKAINQDVLDEIDAMMKEINSALIFLQGEESLQGTDSSSYVCHNENLVPIGDSLTSLIEAFGKFKTRKGVFVISGNTIHKIHHAYLEDKGRVFLLGSSKEFLRSKPEKVREIIDYISSLKKRPSKH